jgi:hypothetical protein
LIALVATRGRCHGACVRFLQILPLLGALLFSGCALPYTNNVFTRNRNYRQVRVTDLQGRLIANWIAEGPVRTEKPGYRFRAVERRTGGPYPTTMRYPQGRKVFITGPNIVVMPCEKPDWLREIEGF